MTVTGKVVDERGAPIAGALIRTRVEFSEFREAVSGADGVYHLHGCDPPGMFGFVASAKGRATEVQERWIGPEAEPVDFRLKPGGVVRIRVIDAQGNPCLGARVHVFPEKFSPLFAFDSLNPDLDRAGR